jgi:hypothetical protein
MRFSVDRNLRNGELLGPAMEIETEEEAAEYLSDLVEYYKIRGQFTEEEALNIARSNLLYYARYYSEETARRVFRLFRKLEPVKKFDFLGWLEPK